MKPLIAYILPVSILAGILLTACAEETEKTPTDEPLTPISLYAAISGQTRVSTPPDRQDSLVFERETVYVWANDHNNGNVYFNSWTNISDGIGKLNPLLPGPRYYPGGNNPIDLYALHGNFKLAEGTPKPASIIHMVDTDQTIPTGEPISPRYLRSDLLYAETIDQKAANRVVILFSHLLCKIEACFLPFGTILDDSLTNARVFLENIIPGVSLNLNTKEATVMGAPVSIEMPLVTIPYGSADFSAAEYGEAIVPPQTLKGIIFRLHTQYGRDFYYVTREPVVLEAGRLYRFNLSVKNLITLPPGVHPWDLTEDELRFLSPMTLPPLVCPWGYKNYYHKWTWIVTDPQLYSWNYQNINNTIDPQ